MHRILVYTWELHQLDTTVSTEDIVKVITYSKRQRDIAHDNAIHLKEEIADLEGMSALTDNEGIILDHIAGKLQVYNSECSRLVWNIRKLIYCGG